MAEMKKKHSFDQIHIWAIDSDGETLISTNINNLKNSYSVYNSCLFPQKDNYPIYFYLQEDRSTKVYASDSNKDVEVLIQSIKRYSIDRLIWSKSLNEFEYKTSTLDNILNNFIRKNNITYIRTVKLKMVGEYVALHGELNGIYPYLILLDQNLNVLTAQIYNDPKYLYTYIDRLEITPSNHIVLIGEKQDGIDGYYYFTHMKFEVDKDGQIVKDYSDSEPYYSFYRGPSAPDYSEDESSDSDVSSESIDESEAIEVEEPPVKSKDITERVLDSTRHSYFTINYNEDVKGVYALRKMNTSENTIIFERSFFLSDNYRYRKTLNTADEGFIVIFEERTRTPTKNDYDKNSYQSRLVCFRFNKEGNMIEQYETEFYYGTMGYVNALNVPNGQIVLTFLIIDAYFDGYNWHYPQN